MPADHAAPKAAELTAQIVSAYCSNNALSTDLLTGLIQSVHAALAGVPGSTTAAPVVEERVPAVPIRRSVFLDYIVCLEDGKKLKMLKRYLNRAYGMTPQDYRERWKLPAEYPMVAPNYAERRSALAKQIGLGQRADSEPAA